MTLFQLVAATLIVAFGAAIQGGVGFGMNVVAAPLLALVNPKFVPGPAIAAAVLLTVLVAVRERTTIDWRGVRFALAGRVPGTVAGALLISHISKTGVAIAVGIAVLAAVALNLARLPLRPTPGTLGVVGAISGVASTVSSIGGPPVAIVYANEPGPVVRGSLSFIFVVGGLMSIAGLTSVHKFGTDELALAAALMVPGVIGFVVSKPLARLLDERGTRAAVLTISVIGALAVLGREVLFS